MEQKSKNFTRLFWGTVIVLCAAGVFITIFILRQREVTLMSSSAARNSDAPAMRNSDAPISSGETIDTLDFFITDHLDQALGGTHNMSHFLSGNNYYNVNWSADSFMVHTWDSNYIYLKEDHSIGPIPAYTFTPGTWMKRFMRVGEKITVSNNMLQWYDSSCNTTSRQSFPYSVTLESHIPNYNAGGDLGVQDVIVLKYEYAGGMERNYYSREWGFILWEEYDSLGQPTVNRSIFNQNTGSSPIVPARACMFPEQNAVYVSKNIPKIMTKGQIATVSVTMRNTGGEIWTKSGNYRLGSYNPPDNLIWDIGRIDLSPTDRVGPGGEKQFTFTIKAPSVSGQYNFQWRMLKEGVSWFGASTLNVLINVR